MTGLRAHYHMFFPPQWRPGKRRNFTDKDGEPVSKPDEVRLRLHPPCVVAALDWDRGTSLQQGITS